MRVARLAPNASTFNASGPFVIHSFSSAAFDLAADVAWVAAMPVSCALRSPSSEAELMLRSGEKDKLVGAARRIHCTVCRSTVHQVYKVLCTVYE